LTGLGRILLSTARLMRPNGRFTHRSEESSCQIKFSAATPRCHHTMKKISRNHLAVTSFPTRRSFVHQALTGAACVSLGQALGQDVPLMRKNSGSRDENTDSIIALLREGYLFIPNRCKALKSEVFQTTLLSKKVICLSGYSGAKLFYNSDLIERKNAAPKRLQLSLTGENGVQSLDGAAHRNRKAMFMSLMGPDKLDTFVDILDTHLQRAALQWTKEKEVTLFEETQEILCRVSCEWSGVPLKDSEARMRGIDMGKMVDGLGSIGYRNNLGKLARKRSEAWMVDIINQVRKNELVAPKGTVLHVMAWHKDANGQLLDAKVAAVEMLNIIRPITAIATYLTFMALALHQNPQYRASLRGASDADYQNFVQEVRRYYPFTPFILAKARKDFDWSGVHFRKGGSVILSVYAVDHDPKLWRQPEQFYPQRFKNRREDQFDFIPHGGGDSNTGHRCAGEKITIWTMKSVLRFLVEEIRYDVPPQDTNFSMARIPTLPRSGFMMSNVAFRKGGVRS